MKIKKAIVIHSFNDKRLKSRLQQIENNPDLDGISFRHCCIFDPDRDSERERELDEIMRTAQDGRGPRNEERQEQLCWDIILEEFGPRLIEEVEKFLPDVIIFHGGTTFFPPRLGAFIRTIKVINERYPDIKFTLERRDEWAMEIDRWISRQGWGMQMRFARNQLRWIQRNFVKEEEIDKIIDGIF